eukprot:TRINITY_DN4115_c0_g1_i2.p1 TRINITY_DN4115_c0_g1~~TRINITY_DN4115_c0_g1_i2.p1  ORF type:complete len:401 (-),score=180.50 TRINITY_DN4115_c0_g1_i2:9-1211(-)
MSKKTLKEGKKDYAFWKTQPVVPLAENVERKEEGGPIDADKDPVKDVRQTPLNLPAAFEWFDCNIDDEKEMQDIYALLYNNYVEDDDSMFRFDYSKAFLKWALKPPGYLTQWHVGVRLTSNKQLMGFIAAIPCDVRVHSKTRPMVEINFLCVHKSLRGKRLAPVLIREITRRVNVTNVWQAVYTAGVVLPSPIGQCRYYHRSLNPKKLIDVGFSYLKKNMTMQMTIRSNKLPDLPLLPGLRPMRAEDMEQVHALLVEHLAKFKLVIEFTLEETRHWLLCAEPDVVESYVVEDPETKQVTDFFSFYNLPSSIIGNAKHNTLRAAYAFYTVAKKHPLKALMQDALIIAKNKGYDVFNALDMMTNKEYLDELKFGPGDGNLHYYLFNWRAPQLKNEDVGLIML